MYSRTTNPGYSSKRIANRKTRKYKKRRAGYTAIFPRKNALVYGAIRPRAIFERSEIKEWHTTNCTALGVYTQRKFKAPPDNISLSDIPQGTQWNSRIGSKVKAIDFTIKMFTFITGQLLDYSDVLRIIIVLDRQANLNGPDWASAMSSEVASTTCFQDPQTSSRYRIIYDELFNIRFDSIYQNREFTVYRKLYEQMEFRGAATGDYNSIISNSLTLWCISSRAADAAQAQIGYTARIRFTDS